MPFLRVIRDKRGYETTYLLHWYQDGARQRSRVLHVFRTPAGVRIGRDPFDPEILREIEAQYPGIAFDWSAMRAQLQVIDAAPEARRRRPRRETPAEAEAPETTADEAPGERPAEPSAEPPRAAREPRAPAGPSPVPSVIQGSTPAEQIAFLQEQYPAILERIPRYTSDPSRQQALRALAERLSPAAWIDPDEITAGLQRAADALERLSRVFGRHRRRARRRSSPGRQADRP